MLRFQSDVPSDVNGMCCPCPCCRCVFVSWCVQCTVGDTMGLCCAKCFMPDMMNNMNQQTRALGGDPDRAAKGARKGPFGMMGGGLAGAISTFRRCAPLCVWSVWVCCVDGCGGATLWC